MYKIFDIDFGMIELSYYMKGIYYFRVTQGSVSKTEKILVK